MLLWPVTRNQKSGDNKVIFQLKAEHLLCCERLRSHHQLLLENMKEEAFLHETIRREIVAVTEALCELGDCPADVGTPL